MRLTEVQNEGNLSLEMVLVASPGCAPCRAQKAILEELKKDYGFSLRVLDITKDSLEGLEETSTVPTSFLNVNGKLSAVYRGYQSAKVIRPSLDELTGKRG